MSSAALDEVDIQASDYQGPNSARALTEDIKKLITNLLLLSRSAHRLPTAIPPEIVEYVESSRNPDIYTREFVELVQKHNQQLKGRSEAFALFRDVLAREMMSALPDNGEDVRRVVESTGGKIEV
ncbi:RNA polymerase II mediator complex subunit [Elasticomyces elasticus]|nr:RNA polymerase II mediator complex subunit [Elasticomyces elasticus]